MKLHIANKNYSSWSMRPWLALKVTGIAFEEALTVFDVENGNPRFASFSPSGKVPVLIFNDGAIWDSLAILEYLAEQFPKARLWPDSISRRAVARSIANEMHAGFATLRSMCPMNMHREPAKITATADLQKDLDRLQAIWVDCLQRYAGPYLMGDHFTNADAMYAPVVSRIRSYKLYSDPVVLQYCQTIEALPAWAEWQAAALAEPWLVDHVEV